MAEAVDLDAGRPGRRTCRSISGEVARVNRHENHGGLYGKIAIGTCFDNRPGAKRRGGCQGGPGGWLPGASVGERLDQLIDAANGVPERDPIFASAAPSSRGVYPRTPRQPALRCATGRLSDDGWDAP